MTEQQAIERIAIALQPHTGTEHASIYETELATAAWNEMKAIAREQGTLPAGWHPAIDGKNKPEAWAEHRRATLRADMS